MYPIGKQIDELRTNSLTNDSKTNGCDLRIEVDQTSPQLLRAKGG